jgi:uncharacterized protein (TIRG00374 family)
MRRLVIALIFMIGIMFILTKVAEIQDIVLTLQRGDWRFLSLAVLIEILWIINVGLSFKTIYQILGVKEKLSRLIILATAANFLNIIAPSGGIGGVAVFITEARSREYSTGRVTVASTLFVLFDYIGFLVILALGFGVLIRRDQLTATEITASIIIVIIALAIITVLVLGARSEQLLGDILVRITNMINKVVKRFRSKQAGDYINPQRAYTFAHDIAEGIRELRTIPKELVIPALLAINGKVLMIILLLFVFLAFSVPVSIGTLIAGFCVSYLFLIVSPTPSGIGIVEGLMTLALSSFYIPLGSAAVLTLAYRGFTLWLPLFIGMFAFRWFSSNQNLEVNP